MGLDINKIIAESVQEFETSNDVLTEGYVEHNHIQESEEEVPSCLYTMFESALVPAIAAGMGALNLRTRLRNLNESNGVMETINENGQDIIVKSIANAAIGFLNENRAATLMDQNLLEISDQWKARLKTAGKVAGGAAALGAAGYGAYKYGDDIKGLFKGKYNEKSSIGDDIGELAKELKDGVKNSKVGKYIGDKVEYERTARDEANARYAKLTPEEKTKRDIQLNYHGE